MIQSADELFAAAPRASASCSIGDKEVMLYELLVKDLVEFQKFSAEHAGDNDLMSAFALSRGCPVLAGVDLAEIVQKLDPLVLQDAGAKIIALSLPEKKS